MCLKRAYAERRHMPNLGIFLTKAYAGRGHMLNKAYAETRHVPYQGMCLTKAYAGRGHILKEGIC